MNEAEQRLGVWVAYGSAMPLSMMNGSPGLIVQ